MTPAAAWSRTAVPLRDILRVPRGFGLQPPQPLDLRCALGRGVIGKVRGRHPQRAPGRAHHGLDRNPRHARHRGIRGKRKQVPEGLQHRGAAVQRVAELPARAVGRAQVYRDALDQVVTGKLGGEQRKLILAAGSRQAGKVARHLLEAQHVRIGHLAASAHDARRVHHAIAAAA